MSDLSCERIRLESARVRAQEKIRDLARSGAPQKYVKDAAAALAVILAKEEVNRIAMEPPREQTLEERLADMTDEELYAWDKFQWKHG